MRTPAWLTGIGADPQDDEDLGQKKSLLVLLTILVLPVSLEFARENVGRLRKRPDARDLVVELVVRHPHAVALALMFTTVALCSSRSNIAAATT
jgi:hypothetical protein